MKLWTDGGAPIVLGPKIGAGGEGTVFELSETQCVKIYHGPVPQERSAKLEAMVAKGDAQLRGVGAWPEALIVDVAGRPVGFIMPRLLDGKDVHKLYNPKDRRTSFPDADFRFLVRTSTNIARAFALLHQRSFVVGDVNPGSVLVAPDARVRLLDCDSVQFASNGVTYLCGVGVEAFTPPELQGQAFAGLLRDQDHDAFGLAVLNFHLLLMGRHPFSGRYLGLGDMPLPKAIAERRFSYGPKAGTMSMAPPPGAPGLDIGGDEVASLFELAFRTTASGRRPPAAAWVGPLTRLEMNLTRCKVDGTHSHLSSLPACPWCTIEGATGIKLFPAPAPVAQGGPGLDVPDLASKVSALPRLGPAPDMTLPREAAVLDAHTLGMRVRMCAFSLSPGSYRTLALEPDEERRLEEYRVRADRTRASWTSASADWRTRCCGCPCDAKRQVFSALKTSWDQLSRRCRDDIAKDEADIRRSKLVRHLENQLLENARIHNVGRRKRYLLAQRKIRTAWDVQEPGLSQAPGIGPRTRAALLAWRAHVEGTFQPGPATPTDNQRLSAIERAALSQRTHLEKRMRDVAYAAIREHARVTALRAQLRPVVEAAAKAYAQAQADFLAAST